MAETTPKVLAPLLDERSAAELMNVSHRTLQGWRMRGGGPKYLKLNGAVRYRQSDLDAFIESAVRSNTAA